MSQQLGDKILLNTMKMTGTLAQVLDAFLKTIEELAKKNHEDSLLRDLDSHIKAGKDVELRICKSFAHSDLDKKLTEKNIPHAMVLDKKTGMVVVATRDVDKDIVRDAINELFVAQRSVSRVSQSEMERMNVNEYLCTVDGLTSEQIKVFQEAAQKNGFVISAQRQGDELYSVSFAHKNYEKAQDALLKAALSKVGLSGELQTKRAEREIAAKDDLVRRLEDKKDEFYIVSATNPDERIRVSEDGFSHFRGDKLVKFESRNDERFYESTYMQMMGLVHPVILNKEQYEVSPSQREFNIKSASEEPRLTTEQLRQLKIEAQARMLVEAKMSLDNGEQPENLSSFLNGECSFSEFFAHEVVNDEHDSEEMHKVLSTLEGMNDNDKKIAVQYIKDAYEEIGERSVSTHFVDEVTLEGSDMQAFIDAHEPGSSRDDNEPGLGEITRS